MKENISLLSEQWDLLLQELTEVDSTGVPSVELGKLADNRSLKSC